MLKELINRDIVSVEPGADIQTCCRLMKEKNVGSVFIMQNKKLLGVITDRDIVVRCLAEGQGVEDCRVEDLMTENPATCRETDGIYDCIQKMRAAKVRRMPVVDERSEVIGLLSFGDLLSMLSREFSELVHTTTRDEEYRRQEKKIA